MAKGKVRAANHSAWREDRSGEIGEKVATCGVHRTILDLRKIGGSSCSSSLLGLVHHRMSWRDCGS